MLKSVLHLLFSSNEPNVKECTEDGTPGFCRINHMYDLSIVNTIRCIIMVVTGRDRKIADLPVDHPSCSKQHAALQYRLVPYTRDDGTKGQKIRPYIIDLESANGTYVNNVRIEARKYVELMEKDVIKFAFSSREYVLLHEHSRDDDADDNVVD